MPVTTRAQARADALAALAAAAARGQSPQQSPQQSSAPIITDAVEMHRQAAINARIANQAARNAQAIAISQLQTQAQAQAQSPPQPPRAPRASRNQRIDIENNPKLLNDNNILNANVSLLYDVSDDLLQYFTVEQLLYLTNNSILKDYYYRKIELTYKEPFVDKFNEICENIVINITPEAISNQDTIRYDILYYSEIKNYFNEINKEITLLSKPKTLLTNIIREVEYKISNEKIIIYSLLRKIHELRSEPINNSATIRALELLKSNLETRIADLNTLNYRDLKILFNTHLFNNMRKYLIAILKSAKILTQTFLNSLIYIHLLGSIDSPLDDMYEAISYFSRIINIDTFSRNTADEIASLTISQTVLLEDIHNELSNDVIRDYIETYNAVIADQTQNTDIIPESIAARNAALLAIESRRQRVIDRDQAAQQRRDQAAARAAARAQQRLAAASAREAARAAARARQRIAAENAVRQARIRREARAARADALRTRQIIARIRREARAPRAAIPSIPSIPEPAYRLEEDTDADTKFMTEYTTADITDPKYNSFINVLKNKCKLYSIDIKDSNIKKAYYNHIKNKFKLEFNKDEPVVIVSGGIKNIVGNSVISLFARYIKNNNDLKFNDLGKYYVANFSLTFDEEMQGGVNHIRNIQFERQSGIDVGGLRRDFITSLSKELFEKKIFIKTSQSQKYFLNPEYNIETDVITNAIIAFVLEGTSYNHVNIVKDFYEYLGLLMSFILVNDCGLEHNLSSYLIANFTKSLSASSAERFNDEDYVYFMIEDCPEHSKTLINLMKTPEQIEYIGINFNDYHQLTSDDPELTSENIIEYIKKTSKYMMTTTILRKGVEIANNITPSAYNKLIRHGYNIHKYFIKGISSNIRKYFSDKRFTNKIVSSYLILPAMSIEIVNKLQQNFRNSMDQIIRHQSEPMKAKYTKLINIFNNYILKSPTPQPTPSNSKYLEFIIKLLRFWSGSSFYKESEKYKIQINGGLSAQHLPQSHTCFFQIDFPDYTGSDDEIGRLLKQKLELAISNVEEGVGLAGGRRRRK